MIHRDPDCLVGKHSACSGQGYDDDTDEITTCPCPCHQTKDRDDRG